MSRLTSEIRAGGSTNLWGGMEQAAELLKRHSQKGFENRVMLFSDGLVNTGVVDPQTIVRKVGLVFLENLNAKVSSYGIGSDFNGWLMTEIALVGQGKYFFIDNSESIPRIVQHSLGVIAQPLLYDVVLRVTSMNGAVVREVFGHRDFSSGVHLGDISGENVRTVISSIDLYLPRDYQPYYRAPSPIDFVRFEFEYRHRGETTPRVLQGILSILATDNPSLIEENRNNRVVAATMIAETSKMDLKIKEALELEEEKAAIQLQEEQIELLEESLELKEELNEEKEEVVESEVMLREAREMLGKLKSGNGRDPSNLKRYDRNAYMKQHLDREYSLAVESE